MVSLRMVVWCVYVCLLFTHTLCEEECSSRPFIAGRSGFVLNTEDSVSAGASYLSNPSVESPEECVSACCQNRYCNLALLHTQTQLQCFLFNCLYRNQFICSFSRKPAFTNYILKSVYQEHLRGPDGDEDKRPIANAGADQVTRYGEVVILNGIESWDDKNITKYEWTPMSEYPNITIKKTKFPDQLLLSNVQPGYYSFHLKVTDTAGQSDSSSVTIRVLTWEQAEIHCVTPVKVGPCRGSFPRWHFNVSSGVCETFTYGGCKPNENNYLSQWECSHICNSTTVTHERRMFKADVCNRSCEEGEFKCSDGCCIDINLECDGQPHCSDSSDEEDCQRTNMAMNQLLNITVNEEKARCVDPPVTGPCRAHMPHWFYDPLKQTCFRFTYGGCGGNNNRFQKKDECMKTCSGLTENDVFAKGLFERAEEQQEHHTGSVALGVVIGLVVLSLIGLVACYCQRNRKRKSESRCVPTVENPPVKLTEDSHTVI